MGCIHTTIPATRSRRRRGGFTLPEVIISATLTVLALAGVMTGMMFIIRSGYSVEQYTDMELQSRRALELFGEDVRMAQSVAWSNNGKQIQLTIPTDNTGTATKTVTYLYTPNTSGGTFSRTDGSTGTTTQLLTGVDDLALYAYKLSSPNAIFDPSNTSNVNWETVNVDTKTIQLSVSSSRTRTTLSKSTQKVISARFIMRNKKVAS